MINSDRISFSNNNVKKEYTENLKKKNNLKKLFYIIYTEIDILEIFLKS